MKADIHPDYRPTTISCACGNAVKTFSTRGDFTTEICSACHPFYTGKHKLLDTAGRIERFETKYRKSPKPGQPAPKKETAAKAEEAKAPAAAKPEGNAEA